jgi:protein phosphatase
MLTDETGLSIFSVILESQLELLNQDIPSLASGRDPFTRPTVDARALVQLADHVKDLFAKEPVVLELTSPVLVIGDLQGHFFDLLRILKEFTPPTFTNDTQYLFLGNLVGRGEFSLETLTLAYLLKAVHPTRVFIIRGNHEFDVLCRASGLLKEVTNEFPSGHIVFDHFMAAFAETPMAAMVDSINVCMHGGIGPALPSVAEIRSLKRPIVNLPNPIVKPLVWSNPSLSHLEFADSARNGPSIGEKHCSPSSSNRKPCA